MGLEFHRCQVKFVTRHLSIDLDPLRSRTLVAAPEFPPRWTTDRCRKEYDAEIGIDTSQFLNQARKALEVGPEGAAPNFR